MNLNKKGFTLLELMVGIMMASIAGMGIASLSGLVGKSSSEASSKSAVLNMKSLLMSNIENPEAWKATVSNGAANNMACLANGTDCRVSSTNAGNGQGGGQAVSISASGPLDLYKADGSLYYSSSNQQIGFTNTGTICNNFSATSSTCPYRYDLTWKAICPQSGACLNPLVSVSGHLQTSSAVNVNKGADLNFSALRSFTKNTVERNCRSLGGSFNLATNKCSPFRMTASCPAGQMVTGINVNNTLMCGAVAAGSCAAGEFLIGFDPTTGQVICKNAKDQFSILDPLYSKKIPCDLVGKTEGDVWKSLAGEVLRNESCGALSQSSIVRAYSVEAEMTCKDGIAVPTGRTNEISTAKTIGSCNNISCPVGIGTGSYFWAPAGSTTEKVSCYGSELGGSEKDYVYGVDAEMVCLNGSAISTGKTRKTEISHTTCADATKNYQVDTDISTQLKPNIAKIAFVIDNSNSMSLYQSKLSSGIDSFITEFKTQDLEVIVLNTSPVGFKTSPIATSTVYFDTSGNVFDYTKLGSTPVNLTRDDTYQLKALTKFTLSSTSTPAQVAQFQADVKAEILAQGTSGATTESGLCNTLIALYDEGPNKFFNKGDIGGIIFLTDDEDRSIWHSSSTIANRCKNFYKRNISAYNGANYAMKYLRYTIRYNQTQVIDGVSVVTAKVQGTPVPRASTDVFGSPCPVAVKNSLVTAAGVTDGDLTPYASGQLCQVESALDQNGFNFANTASNWCSTSFTDNGVTYNNITDYYTQNTTMKLSGGCVKTVAGAETWLADVDYGIRQLAPNSKNIYSSSISSLVFNKALELFGSKGMFVTNIVNMKSCPVGFVGQSISSKFLSVTSLLSAAGGNALDYPICDPSYAGALTPLAASLVQSINNSIKVNIPPGSIISSVDIVRGTTVISLTSGQWSATGDRIDFSGFALQPGDKVRVNSSLSYQDQ